ncbi:uncharacterized protein TM35_001111080 [Trypanosoma theileri]|uniref:Mucin-associated surface protein (MASP) n=1 Tax=Trypanosoma theileri TaxID=67003 RepID=A0A1X0NDV8_9TRYP|nr:uncharacterized protein TM35_001111080 [Trypanosoma theileri]ORC81602.1 hypothetical protein TM35_001111080 [Trypanosoma theileri]
MMSVRQAFCAITIALCCLCSYVVAAQAEAEAEPLEAKPTELGPGGPPGPGDGHSEVSHCPSGSSPVDAGKSQCAESSGGRERNDDPGTPPGLKEQPPGEVTKTTMDEIREEGSVSSGTKMENAKKNLEVKDAQEESSEDKSKPLAGAVSPASGVPDGSDLDNRSEEEKALGPKGQEGKGSPVAVQGPQGPPGAAAPSPGPTSESPDIKGSGAVSASERQDGDNVRNGNGAAEQPSTGLTSEGGSGNSNATTNENDPSSAGTANSGDDTTTNNEESTTTTTTTTTTLPPEAANKKKGDADSCSSISSSVWVRVPLLIVVTLAWILVC